MDSADLQYTPPASVILPHYITGSITFLIASLLIVLASNDLTGHYFQPHILGITHLLVLGWATMIIFGALYQILPVILEVKLYSVILGKAAYVLLTAGTILIAYSFWKFDIGLPLQVGAFTVLGAVTLFLINVIATVKSAAKIKTDGEFIITAAIWLWLTVAAGTVLAFNLTLAFLSMDHLQYLKMHAHMGLVGWFMMLIMGVASRLVPMFLVSHPDNEKPLVSAYYLVNIGLIAFTTDILIFHNNTVKYTAMILIASGIIAFLYFLRNIYLKRVKKKLDIGLKQSLLAFTLIFIPLIATIVLNVKSSSTAYIIDATAMIYGITIIIGFITGLILGKTYKTLPFILILQLSRKNRNKGQFTLKQTDLYSGMLAKGQFITYIAAITSLISGIGIKNNTVITFGAIMLLITALLYNITIVQMLITYTKKGGN